MSYRTEWGAWFRTGVFRWLAPKGEPRRLQERWTRELWEIDDSAGERRVKAIHGRWKDVPTVRRPK